MRAIAAGMGLGMLLAGASAWTRSNPQPQEVSAAQPVGTATSRIILRFTAPIS